jgi:uncharacterized membrane protein YcfT
MGTIMSAVAMNINVGYDVIITNKVEFNSGCVFLVFFFAEMIFQDGNILYLYGKMFDEKLFIKLTEQCRWADLISLHH